VYAADYVEADRTGLVHSAPGHGEEDFHRGSELGLDIYCPVGPNGEFTEAAGEYAGEFVRDANDDIVDDLVADGHMLAHGTVNHSYGHCWRCDTGIIQLVTDQWFISITDVKEDPRQHGAVRVAPAVGAGQPVPRLHRGRARLERLPPALLGIPIPIWVPEDAEAGNLDDDMIVIGTRARSSASASRRTSTPRRSTFIAPPSTT